MCVCVSVCLSVYLSFCLCLSMYVKMCAYLCQYVCLCLFLCLCVSLSFCLPVFLSVCPSFSLYVCLSVFLSVYLCAHDLPTALLQIGTALLILAEHAVLDAVTADGGRKGAGLNAKTLVDWVTEKLVCWLGPMVPPINKKRY